MDSRLLVSLDALPGPVPEGAPLHRYATDAHPVSGRCILTGRRDDGCLLVGTGTGGSYTYRAALDISPPTVDAAGYPDRIDGLNVAATMLARACGMDTAGGVIWEAVGEGRYFLRPSTGRGIYFGPRGGGERYYEVPTLASIRSDDPLATRLAIVTVLLARVWEEAR